MTPLKEPRHCEAPEEPWQSDLAWDCRVASLLAMTVFFVCFFLPFPTQFLQFVKSIGIIKYQTL